MSAEDLIGVEVVPLAELGRPRIDVVCRISGFFRDSFTHLIAMLDEAVRTVAALDEPPERNYLRRRVVRDRDRLVGAGAPTEEAARRAGYRVFGCKPGTYGAGILPLIDEKNWRDVGDFAEAYVNWGGYAYTAAEYGTDARDAFREQLATISVAVKNQDNREHDIFDSDDYLQYHGGMIAAIRALSGKAPRRYFGDSSDPDRVRVRDLKEEALRVFRSRVVNPKWTESMRRHGYKGALELAATLVHNPDLNVLDEPTAGLDPSQIRASRELIRELGKEHTILLSTHILPEVEMTCDSVIVIHRGRVVASSSLAELVRTAGAQTVIVIETDGPVAAEPVRGLAGVTGLESETIPNGTRLRITTPGPRELTPRLCDLAVKQGWKLRELRPQRQSLEEMFVRIVEEEEPA